MLAARHARLANVDCALLLGPGGQLAEADSANLFAVVDNTLCTPPVSSGCLPGVLRAEILAASAALNIPTQERVLHPADLARASEVFTTNVIQGPRAITAIQGQPHTWPAQGPVLNTLLEVLNAALKTLGG